jgi:poly-gamma-glutamate synthesis protein (capsule biosynthesis protein)
MVDLALGGDVRLVRSGAPPEDTWGDVLPLLRDADLRIVSLEGAITEKREPWRRTFRVFHLRAEPAATDILEAARIDACAIANNHALDFDEPGLLDTLHHLDDAGIRYAGAGCDARDAWEPALLTATGERVGLLALTDREPLYAAEAGHAGTAFLPISLDEDGLRRVAHAVEAARAGGADTVVLSVHWGEPFADCPAPLHQDFARAVIERGVDVVHGHGAHVVQGIEIWRGKPILYGCGDLLGDVAVDPVQRNDRTFLFRLAMDRGDLVRLEAIPLVLRDGRLALPRAHDRQDALARLVDLSADLGTAVGREADRLVVKGAPVPA